MIRLILAVWPTLNFVSSLEEEQSCSCMYSSKPLAMLQKRVLSAAGDGSSPKLCLCSFRHIP